MAAPHLNPFGLLGGCLEGQLPNPSFAGKDESGLLIAGRVFAPRVSGSSGVTTSANIVDFSEAVDDRVSQLLLADTGIALNYNDSSNELLVSATGVSGGDGNVTPDKHPASADSMDDEFEDGSVDAKWAWRNQGSATSSIGQGALQITAPAAAGADLKCRGQSVPGAGKWRAKVSVRAVANGNAGGLYFYRSTSGKLMTVEFISSAGTQVLAVEKWDSVTTNNSAPYFTTIYNSISGLGFPWAYLELEYTGSDVVFRASFSGTQDSFATLLTEAAATYLGGAPTEIGIFAQAGNASIDAVTSCDWFRRIS